MRPVAWRGSEQMGVAAQRTKPHLAIACWEWGTYFGDEAIRTGIRLDISPWRRPAPYTAPTQSKAAGLYMICTMAKHAARSEEHTSELQSLMRISYAVFCLKKNTIDHTTHDLQRITKHTHT